MRTKGISKRFDSASLSGAASAPTFFDLVSSRHQSTADTGITYLYRSADSSKSAPSTVGVDAAGVARRYESASYLQVDWEALQRSGEGEGAPLSGAPARGLSNVYDRLLERIERRIDSIVAGDLLLLIHVSRAGLCREELVAISGCTIEQATELLSGLRNHLKIKGDRVMLLNEYIARAIADRYAGPNGERQIEARERLAAFLETLPLSARVAEELPWQLLELGALDRLERHVTAPAVVSTLCDTGRRGDLCLYWNALQERVDLEERYRTTLAGTEERSSEVMELLGRYYAVTAPAGAGGPAGAGSPAGAADDEIVIQNMAVQAGGNMFAERMLAT